MFQWVLHLQLQTWLSSSKTTVSVAPGNSEVFHSTFHLYDSTHSSSVYHQTTLNSCDRPLHTGQARRLHEYNRKLGLQRTGVCMRLCYCMYSTFSEYAYTV